MSSPEFEESNGRSRGLSHEARVFLIKVQSRFDERPLRTKLKEGVLSIFRSSKTPKVLLVSGVASTLAGLILGDPVIFTGGVGLFSFWQTSNLASSWRTFLTIGP